MSDWPEIRTVSIDTIPCRHCGGTGKVSVAQFVDVNETFQPDKYKKALAVAPEFDGIDSWRPAELYAWLHVWGWQWDVVNGEWEKFD